jgi:hypothetical protein
MPMNVIHIKTGLMLNDLQSVGGIDFKVRIPILLINNTCVDYWNVVWAWLFGIAAHIL